VPTGRSSSRGEGSYDRENATGDAHDHPSGCSSSGTPAAEGAAGGTRPLRRARTRAFRRWKPGRGDWQRRTDRNADAVPVVESGVDASCPVPRRQSHLPAVLRPERKPWVRTRSTAKDSGSVSGGSGASSAGLRCSCSRSGPSRGPASSSGPSPRSSTVSASKPRSGSTVPASGCGRSTGRPVGSPGRRSTSTSRGRTGRFASSAGGDPLDAGGGRVHRQRGPGRLDPADRRSFRPRGVTARRDVRHRDRRGLRALSGRRATRDQHSCAGRTGLSFRQVSRGRGDGGPSRSSGSGVCGSAVWGFGPCVFGRTDERVRGGSDNGRGSDTTGRTYNLSYLLTSQKALD
jgi:hypothetical protein